MLKVAITYPLTKQEVKGLLDFLSHHLSYVPLKTPTVIFAQNAKIYAKLYEGYESRSKEVSQEKIIEINSDTPAFYDHLNELVVFQGFSYREGIEIDRFIIPMATIIHELIHFFQYATGPYGSYRVLYEGANDILSCLLTDDPEIDYKEEVVHAMNLAMALNEQNLSAAIQWMKTLTVHSDKNTFVHRSIRQCPALLKYNPQKLMKLLDEDRIDKIENEETRTLLTRHSLSKIIKMLRKQYKVINGII
jgi:hypothetical protein